MSNWGAPNHNGVEELRISPDRMAGNMLETL